MYKILLTGATGYLGSHLAHYLLNRGYEVSILKRSTSSLERISDIANHLAMFDLDLEGVSEPFRKIGKFDAVVHTATCYGRHGESTLDVYQANTSFPLELLDVATHFNTNVFLNTDTFFNTDTVQYGYLNAYALSKKHFSQWGKVYADIGKIQFINVRLEHVFGPNDDPSKFTTWIVRQCLNNIEEIPLTNGEQKRDFIYIDDVVSAYAAIVENIGVLEAAWNDVGLGNGKAVSIRKFVEMVHEITNSKSKLDFGALPYRHQEIMNSNADLRLLEIMGWRPQIDLRNAVEYTVDCERKILGSQA